MNGSAREIYERTMAIVAAVRKGQLLPSRFAIKYPAALLDKLASEKKIGASTEAALQYTNLVTLRVGKLVPLARSGWYEFQLIDTPENVQALQDAISIFRSGEPLSSGVSDDAKIALQRDETYIQSIVASTSLRQIARPPLDEQARAQMEQLLLDLR